VRAFEHWRELDKDQVSYTPQLLLIGAVAAVGVLHTMVPDHWVPIALIARQRGWSRGETARASLQAGLGHVMSTLLIAAVVWLAGVAFATRFGHIVDTATSFALIGFGGWIAIGALREVQGFDGHGHAHSHGHSEKFFHLEAADDPFHGPEQQRFATDEGELRLSIFECGMPPHFRLSGLPIDIARVETLREDGGRQLFRFENRGSYWESIEEIPEPHQFVVAVMIDHCSHAHSFDGRFTEHTHGPDGHDYGEDHEDGPEQDKLYAPQGKGAAVAERHAHIHRHCAGAPHTHWHDHAGGTLHVVMAELGSPPPLHEHRHRTPARTALLLILGSSPMVEGIPAFFAASRYGFGLIIAMATVFGASTISAYVLLCVYSTDGLQRVRFGAVERYGEVLSGAFIALVGLVFWIFPVL
jgi:hypothetical protein